MSDLHKTADAALTTLDGGINALVTTLDVADASKFPATGNFPIVVWDSSDHAVPTDVDEQMLVTGVAGNTFTVTRGLQSTTPVVHADGEAVSLKVCKEIFDQIETVMGEKVNKAGDTMTGDLDIDSDSAVVSFGDGQDASIGYDGSNLLINPADVGSGEARIGGAANYAAFEADGTLKFAGNATVWDDLRVPAESTKLGGSKDPDFSVFKTNGSGSQGVFLYWFDKASEEELFFCAQIPHGYKLGTDLVAHVHWVPKDSENSVKVCWGLEYTIRDINGVFGNTSIIYGDTVVGGAANIVVDTHYMTNLSPAISGAGIKGVSAMLVGRVFRDATGAGGTDDYDDDAGLLEIDFHYEVDTIGSRQIGTK